MATQAPQRPVQSVNEARHHAISFVGKLDSGELLTGTPTVTEIGTSVLTITNKAVNTAALTINSSTAAIGQAVQCKITGAGMTPGATYRVYVQCATTLGQILDGEIRFTAVS